MKNVVLTAIAALTLVTAGSAEPQTTPKPQPTPQPKVVVVAPLNPPAPVVETKKPAPVVTAPEKEEKSLWKGGLPVPTLQIHGF